MTNRERLLAMLVGGLFLIVGAQWAFNQYRDASRFRQNRLSSLTSEAEAMQMRWLAGGEAERQLDEYKVRSLSSDPRVAQSSFQSWLLETVRQVGLADAVVDPTGDIPVGDLYRRYGFRVQGKTDLPGLIDLVYAIEARDQLHRIRELNFSPMRQTARRGASAAEAPTEETLNVVMMIDAISLSIADASPPPPTDTPSWRISKSLEDYRQAILDRNFFQPPNEAPRFLGSEQMVATTGRSNDLRFEFEDAEKNAIRYEIEGDLPQWATWDAAEGRLNVTPPQPAQDGDVASDATEAPKQSFEIRVTAIDDGYPSRRTTQTILVKTAVPQPPESVPIPTGFDDSTQTYLTGIVRGRGDWTAWMSVRTRGETLKLKIGDEFEIGSMRGKVIDVTSRSVQIEIDGEMYELRPDDKLSDLIKES